MHYFSWCFVHVAYVSLSEWTLLRHSHELARSRLQNEKRKKNIPIFRSYIFIVLLLFHFAIKNKNKDETTITNVRMMSLLIFHTPMHVKHELRKMFTKLKTRFDVDSFTLKLDKKLINRRRGLSYLLELARHLRVSKHLGICVNTFLFYFFEFRNGVSYSVAIDANEKYFRNHRHVFSLHYE